MTNATSITIRPYAPGDRDAVLDLVPRLSVGRPRGGILTVGNRRFIAGFRRLSTRRA